MEAKDNPFIEFENHVEYVSFWPRAGAYIIDGILVGVVAATLNIINIIQFKSFAFYLFITLLTSLYKPYFESKYSATLGKMMLKMKVTDYNFNPISVQRSLLRSALLIGPSLLYIPIYFLAFDNPNVLRTDGFLDFTQTLAMEYPIQSWISNLVFLIVVVEIIVLLADSTKTQRALHDQIAKTFVIYDRN
ncbi:MAG: RDD family protein [Bacteroidota bacterium]